EALLAGEFRITPREARRRTHLSEYVAGRVSVTGEALAPLRPAIADEFAEGRISAEEARALCDAVDDLPPSARAKHADAVEKTLVELAPTVRLKELPKLTQRIIDHLDPDGKLPKFETDPHRYRVNLFQQRNGDWRLSGLLDCPSGTTLHALLYHRMKDTDVPVSVRPHRDCNDDPSATQVPGDGASGVDVTASGLLGAGLNGQGADPAEPSERLPGPGAEPARPDEGLSGCPGELTGTGAELTGPAAMPREGPRGTDAGSRSGDGPRARAAADESPAGGPSDGGAPDDAHEYSVTSASSDGDLPIPSIPREAVWEGTRVTVHSDARVEIDGVPYTLDDYEPRFVISADGWPVFLREPIAGEVQSLLDRVRTEKVDALESVVWEKILGRRPVPAEALEGVDAPETHPPRGGAPPGDAVEESGLGGSVFADGS